MNIARVNIGFFIGFKKIKQQRIILPSKGSRNETFKHFSHTGCGKWGLLVFSISDRA
jgi:hypothetical protein